MSGEDRSARSAARPRRVQIFVAVTLALGLLPVFGATPGSAEALAAAGGPDEPGGVEAFVVNGDLASISDYSYYAAIVERDTADPFQAQFCGGAIVSSRLVLTAAHCVDSLDPVDVIVGTDRLAVGHGQRIQVDTITVHPSWNPTTARHDLAVLHLASATSQRRVQVVPPASTFRWGAGSKARVAGFGCVSYLNDFGLCTKYPNRLYDAELPVGADSWCATQLGGDFHAGSMLCAGSSSTTGEASDACYGDSGGPLVVAGPGGWSSPLLVGLVSWGPGCGKSPSAYTRLANYSVWLKSNGVPIPSIFVSGPTFNVGGNYTPVSGDFDGDGRDDVLWYAPGPATDVLWRGTAQGFRRAATFNVGGNYTPVSGDFDGDGRDDVLWYAPGPATDVLWRGTAQGFRRAATFNVNARYTPVSGDFDGDGRDDVLWYGPGQATDVLWRGTAQGFRGVAVAQQDGVFWPHAGDFDGDGRTDVAWYAWVGGKDLLWRSTGSSWSRYDLRLEQWRIPVVGDFNGDGRDDIVFYGPGSTSDKHVRGAPR